MSKWLKLNNENIKTIIDRSRQIFLREGADKSQVLCMYLLWEGVLLCYQYFFENALVSTSYKNKRKSLKFKLKIKSDKYEVFDADSPFNKSNDDEDKVYAMMGERLVSFLKIKPTYEYKNGVNIITFEVRLANTNIISNLKFCWRFTKKTKPLFILAIILSIVNVVFNVILPLLSANIVVGLTNNVFEQIIFMALCVFFVRLVCSFCNWLDVNIFNRVYFESKQNVITYVCEQTTFIKNHCIDENGPGLFVERLTKDIEQLSQGPQGIIDKSLTIIRYIGIVVAILIVSPPAFVYIFITISITTSIEVFRAKTFKKNDRSYRLTIDDYSNFIVELVHGVKDIKLFNGRNSFVSKIYTKTGESSKTGLYMYDENFKIRFFREGFGALFDFGFLLLLAFCLVFGWFSITPAIAIVLYNYNLNIGSDSFVIVTAFLDFIKDFNLSGERITTLIKGDEFPKDKFGHKKVDKLTGKITAKNITFAYNNDNPYERNINILNNVSFEINPGEHVGFVGKTGSGKTTILNLIGKIYDIYDGELLLDDININDIDEQSLRNNTITISQNAHIFNMSIKDNLKIVDENATDEDVKRACSIACMDEFIFKMKDRYNTVVGADGINLSGGQRQRLAIARAVLTKKPIIMFDESTSALDNQTQAKIMENINNSTKGSTILIVAHRLSTIKDMDKIIYIDDGKVLAQGSHDELMKTCESYRELYELETL